MNRRRLLASMLGSGLVARATQPWAQPSATSMRRVGVLAPSTREKEEVTLKFFFVQMRELGWIEGQNIAYDRLYADDQMALLPRLAVELVARKPEVIFAPPTPAAVAAQQATQTIPIVFQAVADPVGSGLVTSLARPGGNVTGISGVFGTLVLKRVELLREILPNAKRLGFLGDSNDRLSKLDQQVLAPIAASLGLTLIFAEAANLVEFESAVARLGAERVDAIFPAGTGINFFNMRARLIELANERRVPVIGHLLPVAEAGALFTYGAPLDDRARRSAQMVDKLLKGAKPADIPVEQPTVFELVLNLKTAKALGITIPQSILLRADRVIE